MFAFWSGVKSSTFDDRVLGRGARDLDVGEVLVAELGERVVADVQHALGERLLAGDGEVPGGVERAPTADLRLLQRAVQPRRHLAVLGAEDLRAARGAQVAQHDDVAVALGEVLGRVDLQQALRGLRGVGVELGPDRPALAGLGVDDEHGRVGLGVARDVAEPDRVRALQRRGGLQSRDLGEDDRARREAVEALVLARIDVDTLVVLGHLRRLEREHAAGRGRAAARGVRVAGEGQQGGGGGGAGRSGDRERRDHDGAHADQGHGREPIRRRRRPRSAPCASRGRPSRASRRAPSRAAGRRRRTARAPAARES